MSRIEHNQVRKLGRDGSAIVLCLALGWPILGGQRLQADAVSWIVQNNVVVEGTLEAAPAYPRVHVQLWDGHRVLTGEPMKLSVFAGLGDLEDMDDILEAEKLDKSFSAILDTGSSGSVISLSTAQRFGIEQAPGAVYHEIGLHGEKPMGVSRPYVLALSGSSGKLLEEPGAFRSLQPAEVLMLNRAPPANPLIELAMGEINVIGMPVISRLVVEIDPAPMRGGEGDLDLEQLRDLPGIDLLARLAELGTGPSIRLYGPTRRVGDVDLEVPLRLVDFSRRRNPRDRGPLPALAPNPVIDRIESTHAGRTFTGDWMLDTGAPVSIISTEHATALGILDPKGKLLRGPDFSIPLGGIGGGVKTASGFRIDRLRIRAAHGRTLEYRGVYVIVHDIVAELDGGRRVTLDGVFGTNLLLPTVAGLSLGLPANVAGGPFRRIWIDGPRRRLLIELR